MLFAAKRPSPGKDDEVTGETTASWPSLEMPRAVDGLISSQLEFPFRGLPPLSRRPVLDVRRHDKGSSSSGEEHETANALRDRPAETSVHLGTPTTSSQVTPARSVGDANPALPPARPKTGRAASPGSHETDTTRRHH